MVGLDALVDLNAEATEEQKSIYIQGQWEACKTGDSIWAFPWYGTPAVLAYNTELLEKAGIEAPPSTYEEDRFLPLYAECLLQYAVPGRHGNYQRESDRSDLE